MAGLGVRRLLAAVAGSVAALVIGIIGVVERRSQLCEPLDALPGVDCPGLSEPATTAAIVAAAGCLAVALAGALVARAARAGWLAAVVADGGARPLPAMWRVGTFVCWFAVLAGLLLFAVLTAVVHDQSGLGDPTSSFPLVVTGVLVAGAALAWTSWRARRTRAIANRRAGGPVFSFAGVPSGGGGWGATSPAADGWAAGGWSGASGADAAGGGPWGDGGSVGAPGGGGGYPRDGGLYGDGPQHGTRSLADQQGGFYDDDHRDLRPPAEQPGNFYSSDPFGREPE